MAKAGKQIDAPCGTTPARAIRALVLSEATARALATVGVLLVALVSVRVAVADEDDSIQLELSVPHADASSMVQGSRLLFEGPRIVLDSAAEAASTANASELRSAEIRSIGNSASAESVAEPKDAAVQSGENQLWLVSTRRLPDCPCDAGRMDVYRFECSIGWQRSSQEELLAAGGSEFVTSVFIHGNDTDPAEAQAEGQQLYSRLTKTACPSAPVRFVIWSWPSERMLGRVRIDIQSKACRANADAYYLAEFLDSLGPNAHVSLSGYSLGARVAVGALHLLGGGVLDGRQREASQHPDRPGARVVLIAGAIADDWLEPGMRFDRALSQTDRMVVMFNPHDNVLRFYPFLYGRGGPPAVGYTGIRNVCCLGEDRHKVCELNVSEAVHRGHGWGHYINSPSIICRLRHELLMHDMATLAHRTAVAGDEEAVSK